MVGTAEQLLSAVMSDVFDQFCVRGAVSKE